MFCQLSDQIINQKDQQRKHQHDRAESIDLRRNTGLDLGIDLNRQSCQTWSVDKDTDDDIVHGHCKRQKDPDNTAGMISGKMMSQNARKGPAPRSLAASSSDGSMPASRALTSISIYGTQKTV